MSKVDLATYNSLLWIKRLKAFDKDAFDYLTKNDNISDSEVSRLLSDWLFNRKAALDKPTWDAIMAVRAKFPEVWWLVLGNLFTGGMTHDN